MLAVLGALTALGASDAFGPTRALARGHRASRRAPVPPAHLAYAQQCPEPIPAQRDATNPLDLPRAPGANPLNGARLFVDGPAHGVAAKAIAQLLGLDPATLPDDESWADFQGQLQSDPLAARLAADPILAGAVAQLSKIAVEPEAQRLSVYSEGGGPGAIFGQAEKLFCHNLTADPGSIPIINTDFLHLALGGCPTPRQVLDYGPTFRRRVDELAAATDRRPAVYLLELDAIGSSRCVTRRGAMPQWESDLRYEMNEMAALPHTVVYVEGGYADANSPRYTAKILNAIGVDRVRGFYTNDTHLNWTIAELRWATRVAALTHGAHFIVNTAQNGRGPLRNPHPLTQGNDDLCNPPGRGLGPRPTTETGYPLADAWLWTSPPGNSSGCGGGPRGGVFWPARAIQLAENANGQLGPGFASDAY